MEEKEAYRFISVSTVYERFSLIKEPYNFGLVLTIWLLLILYSFKRQFNCLKRKRQIGSIKKLQLEIRKNLKMEQLTFDVARETLHASMIQTEPSSVEKQAHLTDINTLLQDINENLRKLERVLK